jgi:hypothetical protein
VSSSLRAGHRVLAVIPVHDDRRGRGELHGRPMAKNVFCQLFAP